MMKVQIAPHGSGDPSCGLSCRLYIFDFLSDLQLGAFTKWRRCEVPKGNCNERATAENLCLLPAAALRPAGARGWARRIRHWAPSRSWIGPQPGLGCRETALGMTLHRAGGEDKTRSGDPWRELTAQVTMRLTLEVWCCVPTCDSRRKPCCS